MAETIVKTISLHYKIGQLLSYFRGSILLTKVPCSCHFLLCILSISAALFSIGMAAAAPGRTLRGGGRDLLICMGLRTRKFPQRLSLVVISSKLSGHTCFTCLCLNQSPKSGIGWPWFARSLRISRLGWRWAICPRRIMLGVVEGGWVFAVMERWRSVIKFKKQGANSTSHVTLYCF